MKRFRKLRGALAAAAAGVLAVTVVAASGAGAAPSGQAHGQPSQYHQADVVFFDGFDGSSVDRSKWNVDVTQSTQYNGELEAYTDSSSTVRVVHGRAAEGAQGGALLLQAHYRPGYTTPQGNKLDFVSGKVDTSNKFDLTNGTVSARMKLPVGVGYWPAFWMLGYGSWPATGEIDVMENIGDPSWVSAATHGPNYSGDQAPVNRAYLQSMQLRNVAAWHTYSVKWTSNAMTFYVDGKVFFNETKAMITFFGSWAFDNPKYLILNLALGGVYPYKMTAVTTPYYGMSQQTLQSVKADEGNVLVDWVKVTK